MVVAAAAVAAGGAAAGGGVDDAFLEYGFACSYVCNTNEGTKQ